MRPARKGPENRRVRRRSPRGRAGFNEAGPQGAGKPNAYTSYGDAIIRGFNEAGPQGAGKPMKTAAQAAANWKLQ